MLATSSTCVPSEETVGSSFSFAHSSFCFSKSACFFSYFSISSLEGLMMTSPSIPSIIKISPAAACVVISFVPTTAGISKDLAIIAE